MLHNNSIKQQLYFFGFGITFFLFIIAGVGFFTMHHLKTNFSNLYTYNLIYEQYLADINTNMRIIETDTSYMLLQKSSTLDANILQKDVLQRSHNILKDIARLKKSAVNQQTITDLDKAAEKLNLFTNKIAAMQQFSSQTDKINLFESMSIINNMTDDLSTLLANNVIDSKLLFSSNMDSYDSYVKTFAGISLLAIICLLIILYNISKKLLSFLTAITIHLEQWQQNNFADSISKDFSQHNNEFNKIYHLCFNINNNLKNLFCSTAQFTKQNTAIIKTIEKLTHNCDTANQIIMDTNKEDINNNEKIINNIINIKNFYENIRQQLTYTVNDAENIAQYTQKINNSAVTGKKVLNASLSNTSDIINKSKLLLKKDYTSYNFDNIAMLTTKTAHCISQINLHALNLAVAMNCSSHKNNLTFIDEILDISEQSRKFISKINNISQKTAADIDNLLKESAFILKYLNNTVAKDYKTLITLLDKYIKNAEYINNFTGQSNITNMQLIDSITLNKQILIRINELTTQSNNNSKYISAKSLDINTFLHKITSKLHNYQKDTEQLYTKLSDIKY